MMIASFVIQIFFHHFGKVFDADLIRLNGFFAPVAGCRLTHKAHLFQNVDNCVLDEIKLVSGIDPGLAKLVFEFFFEFVVATLLGELPFEICQCRNRSTKTLHLIEDFKKYGDDGILGLLTGHFALGVNIKKNHIRWYTCSQFHVS